MTEIKVTTFQSVDSSEQKTNETVKVFTLIQTAVVSVGLFRMRVRFCVNCIQQRPHKTFPVIFKPTE